MSDTTVIYDVSGVVFQNGATLYGSWTTTYNPAGQIVSVMDAAFVVNNGGIITSFTEPVVDADANPFVPGEDPSSPYGTYQILVHPASTVAKPPAGTGKTLSIDWKGETPSTLAVGAQTPYYLLTSISVYGQGFPIPLAPIPLEDSGTVLEIVLCFCAGTRIRTPDGDVPVESLAVGQSVLTAAGEARPIRWIGRRSIDIARHPDPALVRPIRIAAGALADGVPARDLLVSPDHAMLVDGALIPARLLVNHRSITEATEAAATTYHHVELDSHDIILAEGAPTETYLDTGNRSVFANGPATAMIADMSVAQRLRLPQNGACLKLVTEPAAVFPIWQRLAGRAGTEIPAEAAATGQFGAIALMAGARTLHPVVAEGGTLIFALPRDTAQLRLVSPAIRPNQARPWLDDRRMLGVAVSAMSADDAAVPLDGPGFGPGWWGIETADATEFRWSNGNALVTVPAGTKLLTLRVHAAMALEPTRSRAA